ncbi:MAG TPA: class I SAM-dependent methyltransferase [Chlorobaculum parvum]|uniref:Class I SAM-dependent methyltransferase n=1 Tax=Chlorobaculum parvum TaxID=274539 RepID=A0A7C5HKH0_9CHLB|nr:class I SAM-dependent methyltransferase [Chlorobaculum parvum]
MESAPCPFSGSREFTPLLQVPDRFNLHGNSWQLVRCNTSGLVMLNPRPAPDEMAAHYPAESYDPFLNQTNSRSLRDKAYLTISNLLLAGKARMVMKGISKPAVETQMLEVGCSTGRLLVRIHKDFSIPAENLWGIEPNQNTASAAHAAGLVHVTETELPDSDFDCRFDRIVFWHALEHLHRIGENLDKAHELLDANGQLIIALPNIQSHDARRYGANWIALDAPRHLYHFTPDTLEALLNRHGFEMIEIGRWIPDTLYNVWYSEKLNREINGKTFGIGGIARAALRTSGSFVVGRDPKRASSIVVRAARMRG